MNTVTQSLLTHLQNGSDVYHLSWPSGYENYQLKNSLISFPCSAYSELVDEGYPVYYVPNSDSTPLGAAFILGTLNIK